MATKYSKSVIRKQKKEMYNLTRRLYYLLRHHQDRIEFKKLYGGIMGMYHEDTDEIVIDFRRQIIPTLIHEALHKWHPDWSETKVCNRERWIMNHLTPKQIKNIFRVMANNL